jgi:1-acyl-sn-glycerol-3-phosphate acyltransferase
MDLIWIVGAPFVRLLVSLVFRVHVEGIHHVPRAGGVILAPNHLSVLDGPVISGVTGVHRRRATRNLVAAEVFRGPIGWVLRQARQIPIRRGSGDTDALEEAVVAASDGSCIGIFPEGRVTDDPRGGPQRIRSGLTRIALPSGAPVVPVGIWGTQEVWPRAGLDFRGLLRRHRLAIVYGPALVAHPDGSPTAFRERYREALEATVTRARALAGDGG